MVKIEHEFLFRLCKCFGMHFVVKVEGALHFSLGGRLFLIYTLIEVKRSIMTP